NTDSAQDARDLYQKLENIIIPMFYKDKDKWLEVMRHAIALNASFFNTQRMVQEYVLNAYL
ncbi:MAG: alpha-glucan family phosphorylase, partial [Candidatus Omnitrophica bacterium]|nr:alpha-glucan family phosphorylase [Candidatus Omnitrophota bacterium]